MWSDSQTQDIHHIRYHISPKHIMFDSFTENIILSRLHIGDNTFSVTGSCLWGDLGTLNTDTYGDRRISIFHSCSQRVNMYDSTLTHKRCQRMQFKQPQKQASLLQSSPVALVESCTNKQLPDWWLTHRGKMSLLYKQHNEQISIFNQLIITPVCITRA